MGKRRFSMQMRGAWPVMLLVVGAALGLPAQDLDADRLLDPDHLVEIRIEMKTSDWDRLRNESPDASVFMGASSETSSYTYFEADMWIDDVKIESVGIRKKGFFGSNDSERPSLKVKFDEFTKQKPISGLSHLTLNNNKQDRGLVSQLLTYQLFRKAGIAAPRSNFATVTVNGQYLGVYSNVESIKKPFLKQHFGSAKGNLYEGQLTDFHPRALENIEVKTNEDENDRSDIRALAEVLAAEGDLDLAKLERLIDLDEFLKYWAIEGLIGFWDGYTSNQNNYYLYFDPETGKGHFIPWGADWAFTTGGPFGGFGNDTTAVYANSILANRLYHTEGIPERYEAAMRAVLQTAWDVAEMLATIDAAEKLVTPHLGETQSDVAQAMNEVRNFMRTRADEVLAELASGPVDVPAEPRRPSYTIKLGEAKGEFKARWPEPGAPPVPGSAQMKLTLEGDEVAFDSISVTASEVGFGRFGPGGFGGPGGGGPRGGPGGFGRGGPGRGALGRGGPGGPPVDFQPPISLNVIGTRANAIPINLSLTIDSKSFKPGDELIDVQGTLTEGDPAGGFGRGGFGGPGFGGPSGPAGRRIVSGKIRLTSAATEPGAPIEGTFDVKISETRGGLFGGPPPGGGMRGGFGGNGRGGFGPPPVSALQRILDENGDGQLSSNEIERSAERLRLLDRNKDGQLSADELAPPPGPRRPGG